MNARGTGKLRDAADGELDFLADVHHEVGKLINNNHDIGKLRGKLLGNGFLGRLRALKSRMHLRVVLADVSGADLREDLQSALHLGDAPGERARRLLRLGHDRHVEMGNPVIGREFDALRVDHDEADFGGRRAHEDRHDHGVDGHRFAGAGRAADEQVGHLREVGDDRRALDVFADGHKQRAAIGVLKNIA